MLVTKQFPLYFKQTYIVLFLPYHRTKSVVTNILQNIFFYVPQNTVIHGDRSNDDRIFILGWVSVLFIYFSGFYLQ